MVSFYPICVKIESEVWVVSTDVYSRYHALFD